MISLEIPRRLRAACAVVALVAYALPALVGLAAPLGHGVEHAVALLGDMERKAAAMGVAHLRDAQDDRDRAAYAHAHGGELHTHDARVAALLVAAEKVDDHSGEAAVPAPVELSSHLPAAGVLPVLAVIEQPPTGADARAAASTNLLPPPLPPPRA